MNENKEIKYIRPFKRLCMTIGQLPSSYLETMSYYEMLVWFIKFLSEQVIPVVNNNSEVVEELQNYVTNYFDNLDVQEEINNKLDEMAESGELEEIISQYLDSTAIWGFDTVNDMKSSTNLIAGSFAKTLGFYELNDGGSALYKIRELTNADNVDEMFIIALNNESLIAELIIEDNTINMKQIGGRPQKNSTKYDIKNFIDAYISKINTDGIKYNLYIPGGVWYTSGNEIVTQVGFNIYGDDNFSFGSDRAKGTILTSLINEQDHILNLGNSNYTCIGWSLKNINFSSADFIYDDVVNNYKYSTIKKIDSALNLKYAEYGNSDNLFFNYIDGQAFSISSSWENYFKLMNFRKVTNHNGAIFKFKEKDTTLSAGANITACTFESLMFEYMHGNLIEIEQNSSLANCYFNSIFVEDNPFINDNESYTTFTNDNVPVSLNHYSIFKLDNLGSLAGCVINSILLNNYSYRYFTYDGQNYTYDTIITLGNSNVFSSVFNNIVVSGMKKDCYLINMPNTITSVSFVSGYSIINNITNDSDKNFVLNLNGLNDLECNANLFGRIYTYGNPSRTFYENGGWIPCYKSFSKRQYPSGLGLLFYDSDCMNRLQLSTKARTDVFDRPLLTTIVNTNRKVYIRAKVPSDETCILYVNNKDQSITTIALTMVGTGEYKIYELTIPDTWNIGTRIAFEMASSSSYSKNLSMDVYRSC